jgi:hypothetical protein
MKENYFMKSNYYIYCFFFNFFLYSRSENSVIDRTVSKLDDVLTLCNVSAVSDDKLNQNLNEENLDGKVLNLVNQAFSHPLADDFEFAKFDKGVDAVSDVSHDKLNQNLNNDNLDGELVNLVNQAFAHGLADDFEFAKFDKGVDAVSDVSHNNLNQDLNEDNLDGKVVNLVNQPFYHGLADYFEFAKSDEAMESIPNSDSGVSIQYFLPSLDESGGNPSKVQHGRFVSTKILYKNNSIKGRVRGVNRTDHRCFRSM